MNQQEFTELKPGSVLFEARKLFMASLHWMNWPDISLLRRSTIQGDLHAMSIALVLKCCSVIAVDRLLSRMLIVAVRYNVGKFAAPKKINEAKKIYMPSKNPYRVAILGCSPDRGRQHVRAFKLNSDRFEVVALCDHNTEQLTNVASEFAIQNTYSEVDDMLSKHDVDVFCFVTQPKVRLPLIKTAIDYGIKVIAFEKPMAGSLGEALEIYNLCKANDVKFIVSHQQKYGNHYQTARRLIQEGAIGKVHSIHASSKGWLLYWASHLADLMMYLNDGARAKWVVGQAIGTDQLKDAKGHASPDFVMGHFQFENEVNGIMECGPLAPSFPIKEDNFWLNAGVKVYGSDGYLMMINNSGHFGGVRGVTKTSGGFFTTPGGFNSDLDQPLYIRELADWLDNPAQVHSCSNEMAFHGFEMMMGMWLSGLDGRKLEFPMNRTDDLVERMGKTR